MAEQEGTAMGRGLDARPHTGLRQPNLSTLYIRMTPIFLSISQVKNLLQFQSY